MKRTISREEMAAGALVRCWTELLNAGAADVADVQALANGENLEFSTDELAFVGYHGFSMDEARAIVREAARRTMMGVQK